MKKLTRSEMREDAQRLMKAHGKKEVFATVDGSFFFAKNDAVYHNQQLIKTSPNDVNGIEEFDFNEADEQAAADDLTAYYAGLEKADAAKAKAAKPAANKPAASAKPAEKKAVTPAVKPAETEGAKPEDKTEDKV